MSNQHALTIVAMEQKLLTSVHRIASLEDRLAVQKVNSWNGDSPTVSLESSLVHPSDDEKGTLHCEGVTETKRTDGNHEEEPGLKNIKADLEREREELKQTIRILKYVYVYSTLSISLFMSTWDKMCTYVSGVCVHTVSSDGMYIHTNVHEYMMQMLNFAM